MLYEIPKRMASFSRLLSKVQSRAFSESRVDARSETSIAPHPDSWSRCFSTNSNVSAGVATFACCNFLIKLKVLERGAGGEPHAISIKTKGWQRIWSFIKSDSKDAFDFLKCDTQTDVSTKTMVMIIDYLLVCGEEYFSSAELSHPAPLISWLLELV